jgi:DNA-binding MarR family transcriptional regulator
VNIESSHPQYSSILETATELALPVTRLFRAQQRLIRRHLSVGPLSVNEVNLLLLIESAGGMRMGEAASQLTLAPNTMSTVVKRLHNLGLLERETDAVDRRVVRLSLSPAGSARLNAWRGTRSAIFASGLTCLSETERAAIAASLPSLTHLATLLEQQIREIEPE